MSRFGPLEPIKDFADEFHVVGRATGGLGETFRQWGIFKLAAVAARGLHEWRCVR